MAVTDPVAARLDHWQRRLIDLTRRNRLLNFKPTRVTTVRVVDELPSEVFRTLQLDGRAMTFLPTPEQPDAAGAPAAGEEQETPIRAAEYQRRDRAELLGHHTDATLQTNLTVERLETNLLRIFQQSASIFEDQGVNSLFLTLGMIEWYEAADTNLTAPLAAPLLLLPVQLVRQTARSAFTLRAAEDDPLLNPALVEKLRIDFRLALPELPETFEDFDPDAYLAAIQEAIKDAGDDRRRWRVTNDINLGLFTFQKFVMYSNLASYQATYAAHPVIQTLCLGRGERLAPLPDSVREARLDEVFPPERTAQILDADSSQQRALLAVRSGHDLALEGPPGTGKSQTIANLVAGALAEGKTVLFVSEKMAALQVVYGRLATLGLHDFCLELHSNKANKRQVIAELARVLDTPRVPDHERDADFARLAQLRGELNGYAADLHEPYGALGLSPYRALGELARLDRAAVVNAPVERDGQGIAACDRETFEQTCRDLAEHARLLGEVGDPSAHPWRGSALRALGNADRDLLQEELARAVQRGAWLQQEARAFAEEIGAAVPRAFGQLEVLGEIALSLAHSPGASEALLQNERWNTLSADVSALLAAGQHYASCRDAVLAKFTPELLETDFAAPLARYAATAASWTRVFKPAYYRDRKALRAFWRPGYQPPDDAALLADLRLAEQCRASLLAIRERDADGRALFGDRWRGPESDWADLARFAEWIVGVRRFVIAEALGSKGVALAASGRVDDASIQRRVATLRQVLADARQGIARIAQLAAFAPGAGPAAEAGSDLAATQARLVELRDGIAALRPWVFYRESLQRVLAGFAGPFLRRANEEALPPDALEPAFRRLFFRRWLDLAAGERPHFARFRGLAHEQTLADFQALDLQSLALSRQRILHRLSRARDRLIADQELAGEVAILQRELRKRSRHLPLRQLLRRAPNAVRQIKPCFMMSPLSVAQFLDPELHRFDLVVFDEASQIAPEDAVGALVHGRQAVVVGDSKQLPPTNFFSAQITAADDLDPARDEAEIAIADDVESVLDEFVSTGFPRWRLQWHYRSQHESLIAFSNRRFYDGELLTFPGPDTGRSERGVRFEPVAGVYEGQGVNPIEARAVADAVVEHIRATPDLSLGVGTFNIRQQTLILDELDRRRREDPSLEPFFARTGEDHFFVKNLENIQGDDRDVIILSVTYGPDAAGRVRYNFGPINGPNGWRRLNVILTRAKRSLRLFSSMRGDQIDPARAQSEGARLLRDYLLYAERGLLDAPEVEPAAELGSPFEEAVYRELTARGLRLVPQVGQAGYRIDFGVLDDAVPGHFICGIECDGATYHSAATARDRDRLRQQVLEGLGWTIHRVWSTDWYHDRAGQVARLLTLVEQSREAARQAEAARQNGAAASEPPTTSTAESAPPEAVATNGAGASPAPAAAAADNGRARPDRSAIPLYQLTPVEPRGGPDDFAAAPDAALAEVLLRVVAHEAPVHLAEATRRVAAHWGIGRAGGRIRERVAALARGLHQQGRLELDGDYLWRQGQQGIPVRSRAVPGYAFDAETICPPEFEAAIIYTLRQAGALPRAELITEAARVMGFDRAGSKLAERLAAAVQQLVEAGELRLAALGIQLAERD